MSIATPSKLESIQVLRGLAALAVALLHIGGLQVLEGLKSDNAALSWGWVGVDLFFLISGFIMVWVTPKDLSGAVAARRFLLARIIRIYPLWMVCVTLLAVFFFLIHGVPAHPNEIPPEQSWGYFIRSLFLIPQEPAPLLEVGWTLIFEMVFYLIFTALIALRLRAHLLWVLVIWSIVLAVGIYFDWGSLAPIFAILFSPMMFYFILGMALAMISRKGLDPSWAWGMLVLGAAALFFIIDFTDLTPRDRVVWLIAPLSFILLGAVNADLSGQFKTPHIFSLLGDMSYALYLTHPLTIIGWRVIVKPFYEGGLLSASSQSWPPLLVICLDFICLLAACLITAFVFYRLIEQPALKTLKARIGSYRESKPS